MLSFQASLPSAMKTIFFFFFFAFPTYITIPSCRNLLLSSNLCAKPQGRKPPFGCATSSAGSQPSQSATQPHSSDAAGSPLMLCCPAHSCMPCTGTHRQPADCGCQATCTLLLRTDPLISRQTTASPPEDGIYAQVWRGGKHFCLLGPLLLLRRMGSSHQHGRNTGCSCGEGQKNSRKGRADEGPISNTLPISNTIHHLHFTEGYFHRNEKNVHTNIHF